MSDVNGVPLDTEAVFRVITLVDISFHLTDATPHLRFVETEGEHRTFNISVSVHDAQQLAAALAGQPRPRPQSVDILHLIMSELRCHVIAVRLVRFEHGVFFAELDIMTPNGRRVFDFRPSDAVALVLRQPTDVPMLIDADVLDRVSRN